MLPPKRTRLHASVGSTTKPRLGTAFTETVALRPWRPRSTTEVVENEPQKPRGGCPITDVFGRLRPKPSPTSRTNYQTVARSAQAPSSHRPKPAKNPAPTNPGRVPDPRQTFGPPRPKPKKTSHPTHLGRGAWSSLRHTLRGRSRKGCHTAASGRVPGRRHARPSAAEAEEDVAQQLPDGARLSPRSSLRSRSRRGRHAAAPGRCPVGVMLHLPQPKLRKTSYDEFRTIPDPAPPARGRSEQPRDSTSIPDGVASAHPKPKPRMHSRSTTRHQRVPCSYPRPEW